MSENSFENVPTSIVDKDAPLSCRGEDGERLVGSCILPSDLVSGERSTPKIKYSIL